MGARSELAGLWAIAAVVLVLLFLTGPIADLPSARVTPEVVVYHLDDRLFFANADYVKGRVFEALRAAPTQARCVVFDAISVTHIDTAGLDALADLARRLDRAGIELRIAAVKDYLVDGFEAAGVTEKIPRGHFYPTVGAAMRDSPAAA